MIVPAETPVRTPVEEILPIAGLLDVHTPPLAKFVKLMVDPTQTPEFPPLMVPAGGTGLMVTKAIAEVCTPQVPVNVTVYDPLLLVCGLDKLKVELVAPVIGVDGLDPTLHWYCKFAPKPVTDKEVGFKAHPVYDTGCAVIQVFGLITTEAAEDVKVEHPPVTTTV